MAERVIQIASTGSWIPSQRITNEMLAQKLDTTDEWIVSHTGIRARHVAQKGETTSHGAAQAARVALDRAGVAPDELGSIILATSTPDYTVPAAACLVHRELKAGRAAAFDVAGACTGFVYALAIARGLMQYDPRPSLVIGADLMTRIIDWTDRNICVLFGDGAGAVVLKPGSGAGGLGDSILRVDSEGALILRREGGTRLPVQDAPPARPFLYMEGKPVFNFAVKAIAEVVTELLAKAETTLDQVKFIVPHQANSRIIDAAARRLGTTIDKFFLNIAEVANTSAASIPLALDALASGARIAAGDLLVFIGFGAGLTYGGMLVRWGFREPVAAT